MLALAQSNLPLNFSQSSTGPCQQLKTRVREASAIGCVVLTDDVDRTVGSGFPTRSRASSAIGGTRPSGYVNRQCREYRNRGKKGQPMFTRAIVRAVCGGTYDGIGRVKLSHPAPFVPRAKERLPKWMLRVSQVRLPGA